MKLFNSVFVLVAVLVSVSAFAARKPASSKAACGSEAYAQHAAAIQAADDTGAKVCTPGVTAQEGPVGGFFKTYHVTLDCDGASKNYDVESHLFGLPGKLTCTASVRPAGQFEAN